MADKFDITVIIPNYNKANYIFECINSVKNQTYTDFKCIIVDDGSTDRSVDIINTAIIGDDRFILYKNTNHGLSYSRNFGIKNATTELVMPLDSDDYIAEDYLERIVHGFESHPTCMLYYGKWSFIGANADQMNERLGNLRYTGYQNLLIGNSIHCACAYRRSDALDCGLFDEKMQGYEDWEFLIRLLHNNHAVMYDPRVSLYYRQSPNNMSDDCHTRYVEIVKYIRAKNQDIYQEFNTINGIST